jgi:DNA-binding winged helix-turn-helix (wHTH) protein
MNKKHYDPVKIYTSKISRIKTILQRIEEADIFIRTLPDY